MFFIAKKTLQEKCFLIIYYIYLIFRIMYVMRLLDIGKYAVKKSEFHSSWCFGKTVECCYTVLQIKNFGIFIIRRVHGLQFRVFIKDVDFCFPSVISEGFCFKSEPGRSVTRTDLNLIIVLDLF